MHSSKIILVVLDGLGDRPLAQLHNQTPLEAARTPNLDYMAERGATGLVDPIGVGIRPGSDTSHLALLGYDPQQTYTGRGPMEAAGMGMKLGDGDLAFRANFATVDKKGNVIDRRAGRIEDCSIFEKVLNSIKVDGARVSFKAGVSHRGALVVHPQKGTTLSDAVSANDPKQEGVKAKAVEATRPEKAAKDTAKILGEYLSKASKELAKHPANKKRSKQKQPMANALLVRGAGFTPALEQFEKRHGLKGACVAGAAMYKGLAALAGLDLVEVKGATGRPDTNLVGKFEAAAASLSKYDFVFVHIKATDVFGHDGDFAGKRGFIEKVDDAIGRLSSLTNTIIVVTADHSTPCELANHSGDPVPVLFYGPGVRRDSSRKFTERDCATGGLGRIRGLDVLTEAKNLAGRAVMYGT